RIAQCRTWPSPGRARARAACSSFPPPSARSSHEQIADDPDHDGQADRADQARYREPLALVRTEAVAGIPDEVPDAAQHVMHQCPGIAEQDDPAEERAHERADAGIGVGT